MLVGASLNVAVIDSGIDYNHSELFANYAGGYDFVNDDFDPFDDNGLARIHYLADADRRCNSVRNCVAASRMIGFSSFKTSLT
jgi:hypothetical protein